MRFVHKKFDRRGLRCVCCKGTHAPVPAASGKVSAVLLAAPLSVCLLAGTAILLRSSGPDLPPGVTAQAWSDAAAASRRNRGVPAEDCDVLITLARQASRAGRTKQALDCYSRIPPDHARLGLQAVFEDAVLRLECDLAAPAEYGFQYLLKQHQTGTVLSTRQLNVARRSLSLLYGLQMRTEERGEILRRLMQDRYADLHDARYYYFPSLMIWQNAWGAEKVESFLKLDPENRDLQNAAARYLTGFGKLSESRRTLLDLVQTDGSDLRTCAWLLECCYELDDWDTFQSVVRTLPPVTDTEPVVLTLMRGEWEMHQRRWTAAEFFFEALLKRDAANSQAVMGLAKAMENLGRIQERDQFLKRSLIIADLRVGLTAAVPGRIDAIQKVAAWCRELQMQEAAMTFDFFASVESVPNEVPNLNFP